MTHYASHEDFDLRKVFTEANSREFFCNKDYSRVGGCSDDLDDEFAAQIRAERVKPLFKT